MPSLPAYQAMLVFFAIATQYAWGRRLGVRAPIAGSLVGLAVVALLIGILAAFAANLIRPVALLAVILGTGLTVRDAAKSGVPFRLSRETITLYLALVAVGLVVFLGNYPDFVFLSSTAGRTLLRFDPHYSYYSTQSVEMLRADYFGRLRVADCFPREWVKYHFFNSAAQALAQSLLPAPGLFSFFGSQAAILTLVVLSFVESLSLERARVSCAAVIAIAVWVLIGFAIFAHALRFNFITSAAFSTFAVVHFVFSVFRRHFSLACMFLILLGASAIRMLPLAGGALLLMWIFIPEAKPRVSFSIRPRFSVAGTAAVLWCAYHGTTLFLGTQGAMTTFWGPIRIVPEWWYPLLGYKILGLIAATFHRTHWFPLYAYDGDLGNFFSRVLPFLFFVGGLGLASVYLRKHFKSSRVFLFFPLGALPVWWPAARGVTTLVLVGGFSLIVTHAIFRQLRQSAKTGDKDFLVRVSYFFMTLQVLTVGYLATGTNNIKVPAAYVMFDLVIWAVLSELLNTWTETKRFPVVRLVTLGLMIGLNFRFQLFRSLEIPRKPVLVDVTFLTDPSFRAREWIDDNGMLKETDNSAGNRDALSALLGAHLPARCGPELLDSYWAAE